MEMTKEEKKKFLSGEDVPNNQMSNPWSIKIDDNIDKNKYKEEHSADSVTGATELVKLGKVDFNQNVMNLMYIIQDVLAGDTEAMQRPEFKNMNFPAMKAFIEWYVKTDQLSDSGKVDLIKNAWRLNFKVKPPTPAEFITDKYIGAQAEALYQPVKDVFCEFLDPLKPYRTLVLYPHIGFGKSTLAVLVQLYISVHYAMMWHPYAFFGLAPSSIFTQCLGGWNIKKASELLVEPFVNILESSQYFKKVRTHSDLVEASAADIENCIHWTTSSATSVLSMQNGVNYKIISNPGSLLGQNIISAAISELTMFEDNGWSKEKILTLFTKLRQRINSRMKGNYYGRFLCDSQPYSIESPIDDWICNSAPKSAENYIVSGSRWKFYPREFPEAWEKPRSDWHEPECLKKDFTHTFPVFKGGDGEPAKVIETQSQLESYPAADIVWAPMKQITSSGVRNFRDSAEESPINFLRDFAGIPSGAADRILYNSKWIEDIFDNNLRNIYSTVVAKAEDEPEHLIWNQIKDKFFNQIMGKYFFYYEPSLPRVASIDLAISGDTASIALSHVERDKERKDTQGQPLKVYVTDLVIPVIPKGGMINLDAFKFFIIDLIKLGNMNIKHVSFDSFQSRAMMQSLERMGVNVDYVSVDKNNTPYLSLIDYVIHRRYFCGKSIMLKNNLLSLQMTKRKQTGTAKIDHMNGENVYTDSFCLPGASYTELSWTQSQVGCNAKDCADTIAGNMFLLDTYENEFLPIHIWNPGAAMDRTYESELSKHKSIVSNFGLAI